MEWTSYNYPSRIENDNGNKVHQFFYDGSRRRWKQTYSNPTSTETTIYVGKTFEKRTEGTVSYYRHYIYAAGRLVAIKVRATDGTNENQSVLTDHLGSIVEILNDTGNADVSENFSAFGERRDPTDAAGPITASAESAIANITQRGFKIGRAHV